MHKNVISQIPTQSDSLKVKPQYLTFLLMLYVTISLVGCPVLYKIVQLGFITAPGGIVSIPLVLLLEDIIAEVYGYKISRVLLWYILFSMLLFIFFDLFIINLPSPSYWSGEAAYQTIFGGLAKGIPIMVFAIFCGRFSNLYTITKLKILTKGRYFWLRSIVACLMGDVIALGILYGTAFSYPLEAKIHLFLSDIFVRVSYSIIGAGPGALIVKFFKNKEGIDVYDYNTNFNPFKLSLD